MATSKFVVTDELKEATAISLMRFMLFSYAQKHKIDFVQALIEFVQSETYEALFDLKTGIWKEGPDYLRNWYESEMKAKQEQNQSIQQMPIQ